MRKICCGLRISGYVGGVGSEKDPVVGTDTALLSRSGNFPSNSNSQFSKLRGLGPLELPRCSGPCKKVVRYLDKKSYLATRVVVLMLSLAPTILGEQSCAEKNTALFVLRAIRYLTESTGDVFHLGAYLSGICSKGDSEKLKRYIFSAIGPACLFTSQITNCVVGDVQIVSMMTHFAFILDKGLTTSLIGCRLKRDGLSKGESKSILSIELVAQFLGIIYAATTIFCVLSDDDDNKVSSYIGQLSLILYAIFRTVYTYIDYFLFQEVMPPPVRTGEDDAEAPNAEFELAHHQWLRMPANLTKQLDSPINLMSLQLGKGASAETVYRSGSILDSNAQATITAIRDDSGTVGVAVLCLQQDNQFDVAMERQAVREEFALLDNEKYSNVMFFNYRMYTTRFACFNRPPTLGSQVMGFDMSKSANEGPISRFLETMRFIDTAKADNKSLLVHCKSGKDRTAAVVLVAAAWKDYSLMSGQIIKCDLAITYGNFRYWLADESKKAWFRSKYDALLDECEYIAYSNTTGKYLTNDRERLVAFKSTLASKGNPNTVEFIKWGRSLYTAYGPMADILRIMYPEHNLFSRNSGAGLAH